MEKLLETLEALGSPHVDNADADAGLAGAMANAGAVLRRRKGVCGGGRVVCLEGGGIQALFGCKRIPVQPGLLSQFPPAVLALFSFSFTCFKKLSEPDN